MKRERLPIKKPTKEPKLSARAVNILLKEAIMQAGDAEGMDGRGKGGVVGHLRALSRREPATFLRLYEKLLPMQITGKDGSAMQIEHTSKAELIQRFNERGLPLPPSLLEMPAHGEGDGVNEGLPN